MKNERTIVWYKKDHFKELEKLPTFPQSLMLYQTTTPHMNHRLHGLVAATRAVDVVLGVTGAAVRRRARGRIGRPDLEDALVRVAIVAVVKVAIVEIVDVVAMTDGEVAAGSAVDVIVLGMGGVGHDFFFPWGDEVTAAGSPACSSAARMSSRTWSSASE